MIILEAYSGRNSNMKKAEAALSKFIDILHEGYKIDTKNLSNNYAPKLLNNKYIKEVERHLNNEFKFKSITIQFNFVDPILLNAGPHTIPTMFRFFGDEDTSNSNMDVFIFMDVAYIVEHNLTTKEVMAIILHEIGHSLDRTTPSKMIACIRTIISLGIQPFADEMIRYGKAGIHTFVDNAISNPKLRKTIVVYQQLLRDFHSWMRVDKLTKLPLYLMYGLYSTLTGVHLGYYAERKSDSVAVKYGYGPDLATGLNKLTQNKAETVNEKIIKSNPITGLLYDLTDATLEVVSLFYAPHPSNINRANNALYKLKSDLNDPSVPPKLKEHIKKEIKELEQIIDDMQTPSFRQGEYRYFTSLTNRVLGSGTGRNRNILDLLYKAEKYES